MPSYYDDNFGHWDDMDDPDMQDFYRQVQKESVWKECQKCGRRVKLRPEYGICNTCADAMERGMDF
jgi:hypothetical protein